MMKLLALQNANRRNNSFRGNSVLDGGLDGGIKSPATLFWMVLHWLCCLISLLLGFRFSRLVLFLLFSTGSTNPSSTTDTIARFDSTNTPFGGAGNLADSANKTFANGMVSGSRVVVGRHGIRIRPWPHPNPEEVMRAHRILERVQREQRLQYGVKEPRTLIVITPTYVRTFQTLHLTGVMHSLMNSPYEVVWIVVEAGGKTNETAYLLEKSGIQTVHLGFDQKMPVTWGDRQKMENRMRLWALRVVRDRKLDGIVMFADDSNMHSMELFDEIQKVRGIGAVSVGILMHTGGADEPLPEVEDEPGSLPVQGPSCNASEVLVGWHTFNASPYAERSAVYIGDVGPVLPMRFEWAGFVLNSRLLWKEDVDKPEWIKDLDSLNEDEVESPLSLVNDASVVEPLGSCGRKILLWWLRVEARSDSKFPSSYLFETHCEGVSDMFGFLCPSLVSLDGGSLKVRATYIANAMKDNIENRIFFAPYKSGQRWVLLVLNPHCGYAYWIDPLGKGQEMDADQLIDLLMEPSEDKHANEVKSLVQKMVLKGFDIMVKY